MNLNMPKLHFPDPNLMQSHLHEKKDDSMYKWECSNCGRKFEYKEGQCPDCSHPIKFHYIGECVLFKCPCCGKRLYHLREKEYFCPYCKDKKDVKLICIEPDSNNSDKHHISNNSIKYEYESCKQYICNNKWSIIFAIIGFILGTVFTCICTYLFSLL